MNEWTVFVYCGINRRRRGDSDWLENDWKLVLSRLEAESLQLEAAILDGWYCLNINDSHNSEEKKRKRRKKGKRRK